MTPSLRRTLVTLDVALLAETLFAAQLHPTLGQLGWDSILGLLVLGLFALTRPARR